MEPFAQAGYAYRLALILTLSRRQAARCAVAALAKRPAPVEADGSARSLAMRVAAQVRPGRGWMAWRRQPRGSDLWLPWRELQLDGGPPAAWEIALAAAKLPAGLRAPLALCALAGLSPAQAADALGLEPARAEEMISVAIERTARAAGLAGAGDAWARLGPALRYVLDHEPVPPAVTAAGGAALAEGLSPGKVEEYAEAAVEAGRPPRRRWGWRGWVAAALVVGALGLAVAPDAARWLGGPPSEAADAPDGAGAAGQPEAPVAAAGYTVERDGDSLIATGPLIEGCRPGPPLMVPANFDVPWPVIERLSAIEDGEWARVSRQRNLMALTAGPSGWELVRSARGWLYGIGVEGCRPVITVDVGGSVHQQATFRYGDHSVNVIELHFGEFKGELPPSQPVQVAGWPGRLISYSDYEGPPSVYFELPARSNVHHFIVFEGRAGSSPLPVDELLAHLEDFVPVLMGRPSPS